MHYIVSRDDIHDVFASLREVERSRRLREKGILCRTRMHQKVGTRRRRGMSSVDVGSRRGVW